MYNSILLLATLLALLLLVVGSSDSDDAKEYLYNSELDQKYVTDYHPPPPNEGEEYFHPDFLYNGVNQGPRVVEFYAPWCPHCQHFHDHYLKFAAQIAELTKNSDKSDNDKGDNIKNEPVKVYAVSCSKNRKICHDFNVHGYPDVKLFKAGSTNVTETVLYYKLHPFEALNTLGLQVDQMMTLGDTTTAVANDQRLKGKKAQTPTSTTAITRNREDIYNDAYLSFIYTMKQGVFMTNDALTNTTRDALKDWLELMQQTLPPTWNIHLLVKDLLENIETVAKSEDDLVRIVEKYPASMTSKDWSHGCSYTCGLWELFHIMTVGLVEWNLMISFGRDRVLSTGKAADTLRNFIEHFFGCEHCRAHFLKAYDTCELDRCQRLTDHRTSDKDEWIALPLWLFEFHNSVNVRLLREEGVDGKTPTRQDEIAKTWPLRSDCEQCWRDDDTWDEESIYKYMRLSYWPEDVISAEYREELLLPTSKDKEVDHMDLSPSKFFMYTIPIGSIVGVVLWMFVRNNAKTRSGYYKRIL